MNTKFWTFTEWWYKEIYQGRKKWSFWTNKLKNILLRMQNHLGMCWPNSKIFCIEFYTLSNRNEAYEINFRYGRTIDTLETVSQSMFDLNIFLTYSLEDNWNCHFSIIFLHEHLKIKKDILQNANVTDGQG